MVRTVLLLIASGAFNIKIPYKTLYHAVYSDAPWAEGGVTSVFNPLVNMLKNKEDCVKN